MPIHQRLKLIRCRSYQRARIGDDSPLVVGESGHGRRKHVVADFDGLGTVLVRQGIRDPAAADELSMVTCIPGNRNRVQSDSSTGDWVSIANGNRPPGRWVLREDLAPDDVELVEVSGRCQHDLTTHNATHVTFLLGQYRPQSTQHLVRLTSDIR